MAADYWQGPWEGKQRPMKNFIKEHPLALPAGLFFLLYLGLLVQYLGGSPFARVPVVDADYYWKIAVSTAVLGHPLPPMFFSAPLYPLLLTALVFVLGYNLAAVYVVQMLAALATAWLTARCAQNVFSRTHGLVAFVLVAAYFPLAFFSLKILPEVWSLLLLAIFLALASRPGALDRAGDAVLLGLSAGIAVLARGQYGLVVLLVLPALLFVKDTPGYKRFAVLRLILAGLAVLAPLLCWGAVNMARTGRFFISPPNGGVTFLQGNNPRAVGLYTPVPGLTDDINGQLAGMVSLVSRIEGRQVTVAEANRYFLNEGLAFIRENPGDWLLLEAKKLKLSLGPREPGLMYSMALEKREHLTLSRVFFLSWPMLMALFFLGIIDILAYERRYLRAALPCLGAFAALLAALLLFYVISRYRVLLLVPVAMLASHGVLACRRWATQNKILPAVLAAVLILLSVAWTLADKEAVAPASWNNVAYALVRAGRYAEAGQAAQQVLAAQPDDPVALSNLATSLVARKKFAEAAPYVDRLAANPAFARQVEALRKMMAEASEGATQPVSPGAAPQPGGSPGPGQGDPR